MNNFLCLPELWLKTDHCQKLGAPEWPTYQNSLPFTVILLDNFLIRHLRVRVCLHHIQRHNCRPTPPHPHLPHFDLQETESPIPKATFSNGVINFQEEKVPNLWHIWGVVLPLPFSFLARTGALFIQFAVNDNYRSRTNFFEMIWFLFRFDKL